MLLVKLLKNERKIGTLFSGNFCHYNHLFFWKETIPKLDLSER